MKIKILPIFLFISFSIIFIFLYKGLQNSNIYTPDLDAERDIPLFKAKIFNSNDEIYSEEIFAENKFYLLNIWASWCIPCRNEHQFLLDLNEYKKLQIIGINYKDDNKNAQNFLNELKSPYGLILSDPDGTIAIEWGAFGLPETFLVYDKKIIKRIIGPIDNDSLMKIKKLIQ